MTQPQTDERGYLKPNQETTSTWEKIRKPFVLIVLFVLPLGAYMFYQGAKHNQLFLPVINEHVSIPAGLVDTDGNPVEFDGYLSMIMFYGEEPNAYKYNTLNLTERIYEEYASFDDSQFVTFLLPGAEKQWSDIQYQLSLTTDLQYWKTVVVSEDQLEQLYESLTTSQPLNPDGGVGRLFLLDRDVNQRGRLDDEDTQDGLLPDYDTASVSAITNKLNDDVRILLREYRLALKSNMSDQRRGKEK